jgi:hypothetical protein
MKQLNEILKEMLNRKPEQPLGKEEAKKLTPLYIGGYWRRHKDWTEEDWKEYENR